MQPADRVREAMKQLRIADEDVDHEIVEAYLQDARAQAEAALACLEGPEALEKTDP